MVGADKVAQLSARCATPMPSGTANRSPCTACQAVYATRDGDFIGAIDAGYEMSAMDRAEHIIRRHRQACNVPGWLACAGSRAPSVRSTGAGGYFGGGNRTFLFNKAGTTGVVGATNTLWFVGSQPAAGSAAAAAPGGTVPTDATTGSWGLTTRRAARSTSSSATGGVGGTEHAAAVRPAVQRHEDHEQHDHGSCEWHPNEVSVGHNFCCRLCRQQLPDDRVPHCARSHGAQLDGLHLHRSGRQHWSDTAERHRQQRQHHQPSRPARWHRFCPLASGDPASRTSPRCSARPR